MMPDSGIDVALKRSSRKAAVWSIGIFSGADLTDLKPSPAGRMPALAAEHISDVPALFAADPFMLRVSDTWHVFFEVMNQETGKGEIGLATSKTGFEWNYRQIVSKEPFHLSYPYVFQAHGEYFMIPESYQARSIRLYQADPFPVKWSFVRTLLEGPWVDSSIFHHDGKWWIFSSPVAPEHQVLELFYAFDLMGPWRRHAMSPLVRDDKRKARSGGRVIILDGQPIRFAQDCLPVYGTQVRAFAVSALTLSRYAESELQPGPILAAGLERWRRQGMHHIDPHFVDGQWLACVDGWRFEDSREETSEAPPFYGSHPRREGKS